MENIFMRHCRESKNLTPEAVALHLSIAVNEYMEIEAGEKTLFSIQSHKLAQLFDVNATDIYDASLQFNLLCTRSKVIKLQTERIERLEKELEQVSKGEVCKP